MQIDLSGKTALVTGSTAGIGYAIAVGLAKAGATVIVNGRSSVDKAVASLKKEVPNARVRAVAADVASDAGCNALATAEPDIDILVNNVAVFEGQDFFNISDSSWQKFFDINVLSGVRLSRTYLPVMRKKGWGRVVFISSESGVTIPVDMIHYGVTKSAVLAVSRGLAKRMAGTGVTVNSVLPAGTLTEGVAAMLQPAADAAKMTVEEIMSAFMKEHRPGCLLERPLTPEEVANSVVYLCSPQASGTTGAAIRVDGGTINTIV